MLYISVYCGEIKQVLNEEEPTENLTSLQEGKDYTVEYVEERTKRCQACSQTYPEREVNRRCGEDICQRCDLEKYPIRTEDIPY